MSDGTYPSMTITTHITVTQRNKITIPYHYIQSPTSCVKEEQWTPSMNKHNQPPRCFEKSPRQFTQPHSVRLQSLSSNVRAISTRWFPSEETEQKAEKKKEKEKERRKKERKGMQSSEVCTVVGDLRVSALIEFCTGRLTGERETMERQRDGLAEGC